MHVSATRPRSGRLPMTRTTSLWGRDAMFHCCAPLGPAHGFAQRRDGADARNGLGPEAARCGCLRGSRLQSGLAFQGVRLVAPDPASQFGSAQYGLRNFATAKARRRIRTEIDIARDKNDLHAARGHPRIPTSKSSKENSFREIFPKPFIPRPIRPFRVSRRDRGRAEDRLGPVVSGKCAVPRAALADRAFGARSRMQGPSTSGGRKSGAQKAPQ